MSADIEERCDCCDSIAPIAKMQGINVEINISDEEVIKIILCVRCAGKFINENVADMDYDTRKAYIHHLTKGKISPE